MILYFLVSIINSMAQSHLKQRHHQSAEKKNGGMALKNADSSSSKATPVLAADSKSAKKD